jgi:hypothetical protein
VLGVGDEDEKLQALTAAGWLLPLPGGRGESVNLEAFEDAGERLRERPSRFEKKKRPAYARPPVYG